MALSGHRHDEDAVEGYREINELHRVFRGAPDGPRRATKGDEIPRRRIFNDLRRAFDCVFARSAPPARDRPPGRPGGLSY